MKARRLAKKLFPGGRIDAVMARSCAIKDLDAGTEPKSCEVLSRGQLNTCNTGIVINVLPIRETSKIKRSLHHALPTLPIREREEKWARP